MSHTLPTALLLAMLLCMTACPSPQAKSPDARGAFPERTYSR